jgi:hypothetical protein
MNTTVYSKEDKSKLTHELKLFSYGFVFFIFGKLILSVFKLGSLNTWFHGIMALLLIYWCVGVFRKLETSNKVVFCIFYGTLLILIFLIDVNDRLIN